MSRSGRLPGLAAALLLACVLPAAAGIEEDNDACFRESGEAAIAACNRVIDAPEASTAQLVDAYTNRGQEYYIKQDYPRAIADFSKAIELDPQAILAHGNRANARSVTGETDGAIADYTRAIELDPGYTAAYTGRGLEYEKRGDKELAIADFKKAISVPQKYQDGKWAHDRATERLKELGAL